MNNLAVKPVVKSIDESRAEIYAMFDETSQGGVVWSSLNNTEKRAVCVLAGVTVFDLNKPLGRINQFDRHKLFIAIKDFGQIMRKFDSVSLQDFK